MSGDGRQVAAKAGQEALSKAAIGRRHDHPRKSPACSAATKAARPRSSSYRRRARAAPKAGASASRQRGLDALQPAEHDDVAPAAAIPSPVNHAVSRPGGYHSSPAIGAGPRQQRLPHQQNHRNRVQSGENRRGDEIARDREDQQMRRAPARRRGGDAEPQSGDEQRQLSQIDEDHRARRAGRGGDQIGECAERSAQRDESRPSRAGSRRCPYVLRATPRAIAPCRAADRESAPA